MVTVHDLSFFEQPDWHERSKVLLFRRAIRVAARRAAAVVCPSRVTAEQLVRWCRVDAEVFVAPHGVDTGRFRPDEPEPGADAARLAALDRRLAEGRPYLVFVGTLEPRKDLPTLVAAFARIADRHPDALLVLAGGAGWGAAAVDRAVDGSGIASARIVRTGYVADDDVPALLRSADGGRLPGALRGVRAPGPRGAGLRGAAGHHGGHGHGGGGRGRGRAGRARATPPAWPTPSTTGSAPGGTGPGRRRAPPAGLGHRRRATPGRPVPTGTWRPTGSPPDGGRVAAVLARPPSQ